MWGEITHLFPNFNRCTIKVWECISNFIPHIIIMDVITYPCWNYSMLIKGTSEVCCRPQMLANASWCFKSSLRLNAWRVTRKLSGTRWCLDHQWDWNFWCLFQLSNFAHLISVKITVGEKVQLLFSLQAWEKMAVLHNVLSFIKMDLTHCGLQMPCDIVE